MTKPTCRWDVFCRVVDNFGDIGVCWRLARLLAEEHDCQVRLFVDRPRLVESLAPDWQRYRKNRAGAGIELVEWLPEIDFGAPATVVIEAFACDLPDDYALAMAAAVPPPLWINLEYLSAEDWVEGCHGLVSRHPRLGLDKTFVFPGFTARTGGLLRERGLLARREAFLAEPAAVAAFWRGLGIAPPMPGERRISLFGYENPAVNDLLDALAGDPRPHCLLVPEGRSLPGVAAWCARAKPLTGGRGWRCGALEVRILPFSDQHAYDRLLWACDLNLVRGEDSLVRALWAGRPFLWQLYAQEQDAHLAKLEAFLSLLTRALGGPAVQTMAEAMRAWNLGQGFAPLWPDFAAALDNLRDGCRSWAERLAAGPDLAERLVRFSELQLK